MNDLILNEKDASYVLSRVEDNIAIITMSRPEKLNGWTMSMMTAFKAAFLKAQENNDVKVILFTGVGEYFSAGVNLAGTIKFTHPRKLRALIVRHNQSLFDAFINCNKPMIVAVNGHAIGASVTSATLSSHVIASENATFSTPFAKLGIVPEGCSSVHFERLMGEENARRMIGKEAWRPTAKEALEVGLIQGVTSRNSLMDEAVKLAKQWAVEGKQREYLAGSAREELLQVNARESRELADSFLSKNFLRHQARFLWSKRKYIPAIIFFTLATSRPLWSRLL